MRPCSARISAGVAAAARSIIARTAGSSRSIEARSSSESASTCSSSASSISVPSNRSPRLSGAICGCSGSTIVAPSSTSSAGGGEHREGVLARDAAGARRRAARRSAPRRGAGAAAWRAGSRRSASARPASRRTNGVALSTRNSTAYRAGRAGRPTRRTTAAQAVVREDLLLAARRRALRAGARAKATPALGGLVARARSPAGSGARRRARASASASASAAQREAVEAPPRCRPRRRAGRRCRTASASRSWPCRACTGRARSPPTAACARASRGCSRASLTGASSGSRSSMRSTQASKECRPCSRRYRAAAARRCPPAVRPSCGPGSGGAIISRQVATGMRQVVVHDHGTETTCTRPSSPRMQDRAAEVERERHLAVGQARRSSAPPRPRGRTWHGTGSVNTPAPVNVGTSVVGVRPQERVRRRRPALGLAEQVDEALARRRVVVAPRRLDVDLRRQRDREDLALRGSETPSRKRSVGAAASSTTSTPSTANSGVIVASLPPAGRPSASRAELTRAPPRRARRRTPPRRRRSRGRRRCPPSAT